MGNLSKKEIRKRRKEAIAALTQSDVNFIGKGKITTSDGGPEKVSNGKVCNQKGAFGRPAWRRGLEVGTYQTFDKSNHERHKDCQDDRNTRYAAEKFKAELMKEPTPENGYESLEVV